MPGPAPQNTIAKPAGGVLPISAVTTQPSAAENKPHPKGPPQKLKVVIRRLPPGLTQIELEDALGDEWKPGQSRIAWALYKPGKVSKDLSKPSKPARGYFQLTQQSHLDAFAEKVRQTTFLDARNTANDASLLGPPILEFAPYGRVPSGKKRNDVRQSLIDQDPDFMAFLESLTNPTPKPHIADGIEAAQNKDEPVKVTPLIQHLREKKAAKEAAKDKEKAAAKATKHSRQSSKAESAATTTGTTGKSTTQNSKGATEAGDKKAAKPAKQEKITKQTTKQSKKEQPAADSKSQAATRSATAQTTKSSETVSKRPEKSSQAAVAARLIQRDLGIRGRGTSRGRGGRQSSEASQSASMANESAQSASQTNGKSTTTTPVAQSEAPPPDAAPIKPAILKREPQEKPTPTEPTTKPPPKTNQSKPTTSSSTSDPPSTSATSSKPKQAAKAPPTITPNATHAFLKHANPSQGITEPLIQSALSVFGEVSHVEIDKRKGFAYVDFVEPEGLKKAILASPVKVAQGSVQVLERKDRVPAAARSGGAAGSTQSRGGAASTPPAGPRGGGAGGAATTAGFRGGRGRGRGGSTRGGANAAAATASSATNDAPEPTVSTPSLDAGVHDQGTEGAVKVASPVSAPVSAPLPPASESVPTSEPVVSAAAAEPDKT